MKAARGGDAPAPALPAPEPDFCPSTRVSGSTSLLSSSLASSSASTSDNTVGTSDMTTTFRSTHRGAQLREIMLRSKHLSDYQQKQLGPLAAISEAQSRQIRLIRKALKENASEYNDAMLKQDNLKRKLLDELKALKQNVDKVAAEKKTLVGKVRASRNELERISSGRDLYKFSLHGVTAALDNENATDQSERSQRQANERVKQLALGL